MGHLDGEVADTLWVYFFPVLVSWYRRGGVRYRRNPRALEARGAIASDLSLSLGLLRSQMYSTGKPKQRLLVARFAH